MHRAEVRRVRRGHVDHHEIGGSADRAEASQVVLDRPLDGGDSDRPGLAYRDADGDADGPGAAVGGQPRHHSFGPFVGEPQPVHDRPILGQTEHVGRGVGCLRMSRDRAELEVSEAERRESASAAGVLVEASRKAHGRGKREAKLVDHEARVVRAGQGTDRGAQRTSSMRVVCPAAMAARSSGVRKSESR